MISLAPLLVSLPLIGDVTSANVTRLEQALEQALELDAGAIEDLTVNRVNLTLEFTLRTTPGGQTAVGRVVDTLQLQLANHSSALHFGPLGAILNTEGRVIVSFESDSAMSPTLAFPFHLELSSKLHLAWRTMEGMAHIQARLQGEGWVGIGFTRVDAVSRGLVASTRTDGTARVREFSLHGRGGMHLLAEQTDLTAEMVQATIRTASVTLEFAVSAALWIGILSEAELVWAHGAVGVDGTLAAHEETGVQALSLLDATLFYSGPRPSIELLPDSRIDAARLEIRTTDLEAVIWTNLDGHVPQCTGPGPATIPAFVIEVHTIADLVVVSCHADGFLASLPSRARIAVHVAPLRVDPDDSTGNTRGVRLSTTTPDATLFYHIHEHAAEQSALPEPLCESVTPEWEVYDGTFFINRTLFVSAFGCKDRMGRSNVTFARVDLQDPPIEANKRLIGVLVTLFVLAAYIVVPTALWQAFGGESFTLQVHWADAFRSALLLLAFGADCLFVGALRELGPAWMAEWVVGTVFLLLSVVLNVVVMGFARWGRTSDAALLQWVRTERAYSRFGLVSVLGVVGVEHLLLFRSNLYLLGLGVLNGPVTVEQARTVRQRTLLRFAAFGIPMLGLQAWVMGVAPPAVQPTAVAAFLLGIGAVAANAGMLRSVWRASVASKRRTKVELTVGDTRNPVPSTPSVRDFITSQANAPAVNPIREIDGEARDRESRKERIRREGKKEKVERSSNGDARESIDV